MKGLPARRRDGSLNIVVESPRGSSSKFKYDPAGDVFMLSRPLPADLVYLHDWDFIPSTCGSDGDPLDAMVFWAGSSFPGIVLPYRLLGRAARRTEPQDVAWSRAQRSYAGDPRRRLSARDD